VLHTTLVEGSPNSRNISSRDPSRTTQWIKVTLGKVYLSHEVIIWEMRPIFDLYQQKSKIPQVHCTFESDFCVLN
jgi:hypothetical protein